MDRWTGKVAVVTGASAGIGSAIVLDLAKAGMITIGLARRKERVDELRNELPESVKMNLIAHKCDVANEEEIKSTFKWVEETYGGVDVLINNAGVVKTSPILKEGNSKDINSTIDINLRGPIFCMREAFRSMKTRNNHGHIITINSIVGHSVPRFPPELGSLNVYPPTKYGITALTEVVRQELQMEKTQIKITSISPGGVKTEIGGDPAMFDAMPHLLPEDISEAVLYVLGTPERVQVHELIIKPVGEVV